MRLRHFIALACTVLALSACVVEPYGGGRGYYNGGYYNGGYYNNGDYGHHDYGRRVWRE
jgi:hypothetical protein